MGLKKYLGSALTLLALQPALSSASELETASFFDVSEMTSESPIVDSLVEPVSFLDHMDEECVGDVLSPDCDDPSRFWVGGTEFTVYNIDAASGGRITLSQSDTTAPGVSTVQFRDGDGMSDIGYAPRVWVGRRWGEDGKWGVQARYWYLSQNSYYKPDEVVPTVGANFATVDAADRLRAYTIDLEGVRSYSPGNWKIDTFLGARHGSFDIDSQIYDFGVFTTGNFTNLFLANGSSFDGTGLTYGMAIRRPIGQSNFNLFASLRGGSLWGQTDSYGRSSGTIASSPSAPLVGAATVRRNNAKADTQIAEFQFGVEWNYALEFMPANYFFRTAYEYQDWDINGLPTGGAGFGGTIGELTTNSFSAAGIGDMHLNGLSIATGLTW